MRGLNLDQNGNLTEPDFSKTMQDFKAVNLPTHADFFNEIANRIFGHGFIGLVFQKENFFHLRMVSDLSQENKICAGMVIRRWK